MTYSSLDKLVLKILQKSLQIQYNPIYNDKFVFYQKLLSHESFKNFSHVILKKKSFHIYSIIVKRRPKLNKLFYHASHCHCKYAGYDIALTKYSYYVGNQRLNKTNVWISNVLSLSVFLQRISNYFGQYSLVQFLKEICLLRRSEIVFIFNKTISAYFTPIG